MKLRNVWLPATLLALAASPIHAEEGKALYEASCAQCHGSDGRADTAIGRAMGVPSFSEVDLGPDPNARIARVLRESPKHASVASKVNAQEIAAITSYIQEEMIETGESEAP